MQVDRRILGVLAPLAFKVAMKHAVRGILFGKDGSAAPGLITSGRELALAIALS